MATTVWLSKWSSDSEIAESRGRKLYYLGIYGVLGCIGETFVLTYRLAFASGGLSASKDIHNTMLNNILLAPMSFFDTNPKGRILNRFSSDTNSLDKSIPSNFNNISRYLFAFLKATKLLN